MQYTVKNVTLNIDITDGDFTGSCQFYIPFKHKEFLKDNCGSSKNTQFKSHDLEHIFEHQYGEIYLNKEMGCYTTSSADLLIAYLSWLLDSGEKVEVDVEYANPFWAIHDMEHAQNDESGCTVYVDEHIELQRLKDAFEIFLKEGYELDYEFVQEVEEAYNGRFGTSVSFEEYLYLNEEELEEDEYSNC